jgi:hypothetical protein
MDGDREASARRDRTSNEVSRRYAVAAFVATL